VIVLCVFVCIVVLDGRLLTTTEMQQLMCDGYNHQNHHQEETAHRTFSVKHFISQEEHPVLGVPFLVLHPCESGMCLRMLLESREGETKDQHHPLAKLLAWMSLVQGCTAIHVPPEYNDILRRIIEHDTNDGPV
jgi:hypothetical protein